MKIALVGAPGSGKSELAHEIARELEKYGRYRPVTVVDNYVQQVENECDLAVGMMGSYLADMAVAVARIGQERVAARDGAETVITCGTLAETITHTAVNLTVDPGQYGWAIANVSMPYYSLMAATTLDYDLVLYAGPPNGESEFAKVIDQELPGALESLKIIWLELRRSHEVEDTLAWIKNREGK